MRLRVFGVRGSIPTPGPTTVRYGGNTTCLTIETGEDLIVFDAGSGIRTLGLELAERGERSCHVFISHTHWDHIQGLPFFAPLFRDGSRIALYGAFDPVYQKDLKAILTTQMEYCYFPVRTSELRAELSYRDLREGEPVQIGAATVTPILMNHPVLTFGYRIDCDGKRFFFTGDHEPPRNLYEPDDGEYAEYQRFLDNRRETLIRFIEGADLVVADAQYTEDEYRTRIGWGHGTYGSCIDLAAAAGAKRLVLTHHDPLRTDDELDALATSFASSPPVPSLQLEIGREGTEFSL